MNSHFGASDQWKFNAKFKKKQQQCLALKSTYEKKYGKYVIPQQGPTAAEQASSLLAQDRQQPDLLRDEICDNRKLVARCQYEIGVPYYEQECPGVKKNLTQDLARYKRAKHKTFNQEKECGNMIVTTKEEAAAFDELYGVGGESSIPPSEGEIREHFCSKHANPKADPTKHEDALVGLNSLYKRLTTHDCECSETSVKPNVPN